MTYQQQFYGWLRNVNKIENQNKKLSELNSRFGRTRSLKYKKLLLSTMANVYRQENSYDNALSIYLSIIDMDENDVVTKVTISSMYFYDVGDLPQALLWANSAIASAKIVKRFLALALGTRGRVALAIGDYALLQETLFEQINIDRSLYTVDSRREWDFFDNADKSKLPRHLVDIIERGRL